MQIRIFQQNPIYISLPSDLLCNTHLAIVQQNQNKKPVGSVWLGIFLILVLCVRKALSDPFSEEFLVK